MFGKKGTGGDPIQFEQELSEALESYAQLQARYFGVSERKRRTLKSSGAKSEKSLREQSAKREQILATRAANQRTAAELACRDAILGLAPVSTEGLPGQRLDPLAAASYVSIGEARYGSDHRRASIPAVVQLLDCANLLIVGSWPGVIAGTIRTISVQALSGTGPGQLNVSVIDPTIRNPLAALSALSGSDEAILPRPVADETSVLDLLNSLTEDVRVTVESFKGANTTLGAFRRKMGQPLGRYHIVVICDFPRAFTDRSAQVLSDLLREGPRCGLSFLVHHDPAQRVEHPKVAEVLGEMLDSIPKINVQSGVVTASWLPEWEVSLSPAITLTDAAEAAKQIAAWASDAAAPVISYSDVQPEKKLMWDTSAERLVATIGLIGAEPVTITLGDEREQRHNILVSGAVGQGKSNLLMVIIHSLAQRYSPQELEMHLLDFKDGVTLYPLAAHGGSQSWLPHAKTLGLNSDREYGAAVLRSLVAEFARRAAVMRTSGDSITAYRRANSANSMPRILVVIDEFQVLFESDDEISQAALIDLERLARKGRAYGIHLILASQTLSGITTILTKSDGIFSQFPYRLALKNSSSESRVVLDQNNNEAARLRYRGELVVNTEFGSQEGNRRATVAFADPSALKELRSRLVAMQTSATPPLVFDGASPSRIEDALAEMRHLRNAVSGRQEAPRLAVLGRAIDVGTPLVGFPIQGESGRHLAVVGLGTDPLQNNTDGGQQQDLALGALHAALFSLAVQHPDGDADFIILDYLSDGLRQRVGQRQFIGALSMLAPVHTLVGADANAFLMSLTDQIAERSAGKSERTLYIAALGLDRAADLDTGPDYDRTPLIGLKALLTQGAQRNAHLLAWWGSYRSMRAHLGYDAGNTISGLLALRVSPSDVQDLFGPLVRWRSDNARGLYTDLTSGKDPAPIIPFGHMTAADVTAVEGLRWDL